VLERLAGHFVGRSPYDVTALVAEAFQREYVAAGAMLMRAANGLFSGFDMALWDLQGRRAGLPVHRLFGGAHRERVGYFHFVQGDTAEELAADAARGAAAGERVFYVKVGRGERLDLEIVQAVRREIGDARLRLDANEAWDPHDAIRMCRKLEPFDIEFVEQPTPSWSIEALAQVKASVGIPIVADQSAFTLHDVYEICRRRAADMICIGLREIGGVRPMLQVAAIAEAAGLRICIHGSFTSGITTCAEHQAALAIPNLDDGNQIMWQLLREDVVAAPDLRPREGWIAALTGPGLGFELDEAAVERAEAAYRAANR
jgi:muconate cycloisomerase